MNPYQKRKARMIAGVLISAAAASDTPMSKLAVLAAGMTPDQWRTVAFQVGQPVPDQPAKLYTVALLLGLQ